MATRWSHPRAVVEARIEGELTVVIIDGAMDVEDDALFAARAHQEGESNRTHGMLVDFRRCRIEFDVPEAVAAVSGVLNKDAGPPLPIAMIVTPEDVARFKAFAAGISSHRAVRQVFTNRDEGFEWASRKALIRRLEIQRRTRRP
jgi:hypothetical protein